MINLAQEHAEKISKGFGLVTWLFFFMTASSTMFFILSADGSLEFRRVMTFVTAFTLPFLLLLALSRVSGIGDRIKSNDFGEPLFFMKNPTLRDLIVVPVGLVTVFASSIILSGVGQDFSALMVAGIVIGGSLFITRSIIIPILIHGAYNSIIYLNSIGVLGNIGIPDNLPITVPLINAQINQFGEIVPEVVFQFGLTATGEEMFRVLLIAGFLLASSGEFATKKLHFIIGIIVAGTAWAVFHAIQGGIQIL